MNEKSLLRARAWCVLQAGRELQEWEQGRENMGSTCLRCARL